MWFTSRKQSRRLGSCAKRSFTLEDSGGKHPPLSVNFDRTSVIIAKSLLTTKLSNARSRRYAEDALKKVITIVPALRPLRNACYVVDPTNPLAKLAGNCTRLAMRKRLRLIQLNVWKGDAAHESLMNDEDIEDAAVVAVRRAQGVED